MRAVPHGIFWIYLLVLSVAELLTAVVSPHLGLAIHAGLMLTLLVHSGMGATEAERRLALGLTLAPLIRLLSLTLPLLNFSGEARFPLVAAPLLLAAWIAVRQLKVARQAMGLRIDHLGLQVLLTGGGLGLGALEYVILRPDELATSFEWRSLLLVGLNLLIFTGFAEEFIFRGLLQHLAGPILRGGTLIYVSLVFGALHIGYLSVLDVIFVTAVGWLFAYLVRWSGSILGVTLAHGLTNFTLFVIMPYLALNPTHPLAAFAPWVIGAGSLGALVSAGLLWRRFQARQGQPSTSGPESMAPTAPGRDLSSIAPSAVRAD